MRKVRSYIKRDRVRGIIQSILIIGLLVAVIALGVRLAKNETENNKTILALDSYQVGTLSIDGDEPEIITTSGIDIISRSPISLDGLEINIDKDADISYSLYYLDKDGVGLEESDNFTKDFVADEAELPTGATHAYVIIHPNNDDDNTISLIEQRDYVNQLTVSYNK